MLMRLRDANGKLVYKDLYDVKLNPLVEGSKLKLSSELYLDKDFSNAAEALAELAAIRRKKREIDEIVKK